MPPSGWPGPTSRPRRSAGASRAAAGGATTTPRRSSSSAGSRTRSILDGGKRMPCGWIVGGCSRMCAVRGLVAATQGDVERAALVLRGGTQHEEVGDLFGRSRALLALGIIRRRARQKRPAREAIEAALEGFEQLGAASWVEKARAELDSVGGAQPGRRADSGRAPRRNARGRRSDQQRDRGHALPRRETVGTHLSQVYAKLGIHSRTELVRTLH